MIVSGLRAVIANILPVSVAVYIDDVDVDVPMPHVFLSGVDTNFANTMDDETDDFAELVSSEVEIKVRAARHSDSESVATKVASFLQKFSGSMGVRTVEAVELQDWRSDPEEAWHGTSRGRTVIVVPVIIHHRPA